MTIDDTAPIHQLDRLLDGIGGDERGDPDAEWSPTLRRLARLDDDLAPRGDVLRDVRHRVLGDAGCAVVESALALGSSPLSAGVEFIAPVAAVRARWRDERWGFGAAAAAAVLLLAVGSVWLGRETGSAPPDAAPSIAMIDAAPAAEPRSDATDDPGFPRDLGPIAAADVARVSIGGFGSDDLVGLVAIGADFGQREYAARRERLLRNVDESWTAFVEERRWRDLLGDSSPDAQEAPRSTLEGAG